MQNKIWSEKSIYRLLFHMDYSEYILNIYVFWILDNMESESSTTSPSMMCWFLLLQPGFEGRNCIADEHYVPTFFSVSSSNKHVIVPQYYLLAQFLLRHSQLNVVFSSIYQMVDPGGIANWSVTHVDWSEAKWHPKSYSAQDVSYELLKNIMVWSCLTILFFGMLEGLSPSIFQSFLVHWDT